MTDKKHKISDYWSMGTAIGLCAAVGVVLGAVMQNVVLWMCMGAGVCVVLGAVTEMNKKNREKR